MIRDIRLANDKDGAIMAGMKKIRTAVVTGGSSGIGFMVAQELRAAGVRLVITGRDKQRLSAAAKQLHCRAIQLDLNDRDSVDGFFRKLGSGPLDCFVANAGSPVKDPDDQQAQTRGAIEVVSRAADLLAEGGVLLVTNTLFTQFPYDVVPPVFRAYVSGKRDLTRQLAEVSLAYPGVRAADVALGFVPGTRGLDQVMNPAEAEEYVRAVKAATPREKLTTVEQAASFIVQVLQDTVGGVRVGIDGSVSELSLVSVTTP
ncbi:MULTISPECIES: SDR family NAD(P)-dependent oxidoreductase [Amycolatopsis]|uniref:SDR family NAD(P)-dependent oxidoreductase n=1 Tax=Amycolatopsis albidoflavus TaxID=102226 RepID=A0ABW5HT84_9PSEU